MLYKLHITYYDFINEANKICYHVSMSGNNTKKVVLIILDGWGLAKPSRGNAIFKAKTPAIDMLEKKYFSASLQASGIAAGLPWGQEGNSEVGHINLGSGRIVYQYLPRITTSIRDGSFFKNETFLRAINFVKRNNSTLHLMGLTSSGTVHSYIDHLYGLLDLAKKNKIDNVRLHVFTDGKDSNPYEAVALILKLQHRMQKNHLGKIATVIGRVYAMDRNNKWDFTQKTYDLMTKGAGVKIENIPNYIENSYKAKKTDFNIEPAVVYENNEPVGLVREGDALIFFNFREDSARQITKSFVQDGAVFNKFPRDKISNLYFVGMTKYENDLPMEVAFSPPIINNPLAKILEENKKTQLRIAESEKYAHVTYFFNGEEEKSYTGEDRIVIPSQGTPHYDTMPEMQAYNITQKFYENMEKYDFFLINFANADILSHVGNFEATVKGIEIIDANISGIVSATQSRDMTLIITSDHGHAEEMLNLKTGEIKTSHTTNPVPFHLINPKYKARPNSAPLYTKEPNGVLADVAPTILKLMNLPKPEEMTGKSLI